MGKPYTASQKKTHPFASVWYTIGFLWAKITFLYSTVMLSFKHCTKRFGLELSNELLFIIIAQGAAKLWPVIARGPR